MKARKWYGYVTASKGSLLLGGTKHHESDAQFDTQEQASHWVSVIVATNCEASRQVAAWGTGSKQMTK